MFCNWLQEIQEYLINSIEMLRKLCVHYWQCITFLSFASGVYYLVLLSPILIRWRKYYVRFCILHVMILVLISTQLLYASESRRSVVRALREQLCNEGKTRSDTMRTLRLVEILSFIALVLFTGSHLAQWGNCPHCGQKYSNQSALKYHVRLVHSDLTNRLCCYLCPRAFTHRDSFKKHMWERHKVRI